MRIKLSSNSEVAHFWANKVQDRGETGNMFFENGTIYSYGYHFPIATHYKDMVLFTTQSYSSTTAQHIVRVRVAIPHDNVIYMDNIKDPSNEKNVTILLDNIKELLKKATRSRLYKEQYLQDAQKAYEDAKTIKKLFKIKVKIPKLTFNDEALDTLKVELKKESAKKKIENAKRLKELLKEYEVKVTEFRNGDINSMPYSFKDLNKGAVCRINGDNIVTSDRANVPIKDAKILLLAIKLGKDLSGMKVGYYNVDGWITVKKEKFLKVGCHKFHESEYKYMLELLGV